jgi:NAD(P)-dependent dehydrogenase (short-subunit alcohol dehydrogenase family)
MVLRASLPLLAAAAALAPALAVTSVDVFVYGATSGGIGAAIAEEFVAAGARVLLTGRKCADAEAAAARLGGDAIGFAYESGVEGAPEALAKAVSEAVGALDVLVNNAAILKPHFLTRVSHSELDELLSVNVKAPFFLCNGLHPLLKASGRSAIVTITAAGGHRPMPGIGAYCASKAALINFTIAMAKGKTSSKVAGAGKKGVLLAGVRPGGGAEKGGLRKGDVVVRLGKSEVASVEDLMFVLNASKPGETVPAVVLRDGKELKLEVTFQESQRPK